MPSGTAGPPDPGSLAPPITVEGSALPPGDLDARMMHAAAIELAELAGLAAHAAAIGGRVALQRERTAARGVAGRWQASAAVSAVGRASATVTLTLYAVEAGELRARGGGTAALVLLGPDGRVQPWPPELRASFAAWQADGEG